jgi:GH15 family glucan-1,4-alpha-glucosidase
MHENFTYSLAICARGLLCANGLKPNKRWLKVAHEMIKQIESVKGHFTRSFGKFGDDRIDASLLGLVWPASIIKADDTRMLETVRLIEEKLVQDMGVHRYEGDDYDGWMYKKSIHRKKGAGYWPLLNFWMSIYYMKKGDKVKARSYFDKVLRDVGGPHIPEQVFSNDVQVSVKPLAWSHAMYVISASNL